MPQRRNGPAWTTIKKACPGCGTPIAQSQVASSDCWRRLPRDLQIAYLTAKNGDCDSGQALAAATAAIEAELRKAAIR